MKLATKITGTTLTVALFAALAMTVGTADKKDENEKHLKLVWAANTRVTTTINWSIGEFKDGDITAGRYWEENTTVSPGETVIFRVQANKYNLTVCKIEINGKVKAESPDTNFNRCVLNYTVSSSD